MQLPDLYDIDRVPEMVCNTRGVELFAGVKYSLESQQVTLRKAEKRKGWARGAVGAR